MNLLAIETSTDYCSVSLCLKGVVCSDHRLAARQHGALVLPMIDALMSEAGISARQLDGVVYGRGPGSFTGVRIGVALTQGIALGADIGVIGISTLQSVAQGCFRQFSDSHIAVSIDARMDEVYFATFVASESGLMTSVSDEQVCAQSDVPALSSVDQWHWVGSGAERYADVLYTHFSVQTAHIRQGAWPHAEDLLSLAKPLAAAGEFSAPEHATPVYLRNKVAQTTAERDAAKGS